MDPEVCVDPPSDYTLPRQQMRITTGGRALRKLTRELQLQYDSSGKLVPMLLPTFPLSTTPQDAREAFSHMSRPSPKPCSPESLADPRSQLPRPLISSLTFPKYAGASSFDAGATLFITRAFMVFLGAGASLSHPSRGAGFLFQDCADCKSLTILLSSHRACVLNQKISFISPSLNRWHASAYAWNDLTPQDDALDAKILLVSEYAVGMRVDQRI
jgi:hypothetical protein